MKKTTWIIIAGAVIAAGVAGYIFWKKKKAAELPEPEEETPEPAIMKDLSNVTPKQEEKEWGMASKVVRASTTAVKNVSPALQGMTKQAVAMKTTTPALATARNVTTLTGKQPVVKPAVLARKGAAK